MKLAVVIPAYNAEKTLAQVVGRIPDGAFGIWIVDDSSSDGTLRVAGRLAQTDPRVRIVRRKENGGYGAAMKSGLQAVAKEGATMVACVHADGQYAPEELPAMQKTLEQEDLDLLQGSRIASGTAFSGGMPAYKYLAGRALTFLENRVFGLQMSDYHSGYLLYGKRALASIQFGNLSDSFDFDLEVIASARALGLRIGERPIPTHYGEESSSLSPIPYGFRVLGVMLKYLRGHYR